MEKHYTIGLDYGSLSCRGVLACTADGEVVAEAEFPYPHGVLYDALPDGTPLPPQWALQHPQDYVDAFQQIITSLLQESGVPPETVIGLCIDTTASTVVAADKDLMPLCQLERYAHRPHAWVKMWKHHAAWREAEEITAEGLPVLARYGGEIGAEFLLPKLLQTSREDPDVFAAAETFWEYGDWMSSLLTGREVRSGTYLTCKSMWIPESGYPDSPLLKPLEEKLAFHSGTRPVIAWPGQSVGTLVPDMAKVLGLHPGTVVSAPLMDSYAGLPGSGISDGGMVAMMLGTSNSYLLLDKEDRQVSGICASVRDSILPGFTGYAAGQASAGDVLGWFVENCVPAAYEREAMRRQMELHAYLAELSGKRKPGESGLLALEWWNGNKSVLNNARLSGMLVGMTLATRPEDIYRALIESTAFGARRIFEAFRQADIPIIGAVASGGLAQKNPLLMQIYADVLGMPLAVSPQQQTAALGSAMYAAAAAGSAAGGYDSVAAAVRSMSRECTVRYQPDREAQEVYDRLYGEYLALHDYFGQGGNRVMERLKGRSSRERNQPML